jgi:hypothetical protein
VRGKFGFLLRCSWQCEVLWLLVEFGTAKELVVECEDSNCTTTRFDFHGIFVFHREMQLFWFAFLGLKGFFVCLDMNVVPNKLCSSFMKAKFHKLGTHMGTFWLRICKGFLHQRKKMMYMFMSYTYGICTNMNASWNSNIEFDTLFFEVELEKNYYFSVYKYIFLQDLLHGVIYICIFYIKFGILLY